MSRDGNTGICSTPRHSCFNFSFPFSPALLRLLSWIALSLLLLPLLYLTFSPSPQGLRTNNQPEFPLFLPLLLLLEVWLRVPFHPIPLTYIFLSFLPSFIRSIRSLYHFPCFPLLSLRSGFVFLPLFTWFVRSPSPSPSSCNLRVIGSLFFTLVFIYLFTWLPFSYVPCALFCDSNYLNYLALGGWKGKEWESGFRSDFFGRGEEVILFVPFFCDLLLCVWFGGSGFAWL